MAVVGVDLFASFQRDTAVMFPKTQRLGRLKRCMFKHVSLICQQIRHQLKGLDTRRDGGFTVKGEIKVAKKP